MEANPDDALMWGQKVEDLGGGRPVFAAQTGHDGLAQFEDGEDDLLVPGKKSGKKSSKIRNKIVKKIQKRINRNFLGLSYLDKAEGIKVSSIGSKVIEAAEASGRALKTLISANLTMRPDSKSISDPVAGEAHLVSKAILVS